MRRGDGFVKHVHALTDGLGVHAAINISDHDTAANISCTVTRIHGIVVQVAQPSKVSIDFQEFVFRDIHVRGTLIAGQEHSQQAIRCGKIMHPGRNELVLLYGLHEIPKMIELAHSGMMKGKAVCVVDKAQADMEKGIV